VKGRSTRVPGGSGDRDPVTLLRFSLDECESQPPNSLSWSAGGNTIIMHKMTYILFPLLRSFVSFQLPLSENHLLLNLACYIPHTIIPYRPLLHFLPNLTHARVRATEYTSTAHRSDYRRVRAPQRVPRTFSSRPPPAVSKTRTFANHSPSFFAPAEIHRTPVERGRTRPPSFKTHAPTASELA